MRAGADLCVDDAIGWNRADCGPRVVGQQPENASQIDRVRLDYPVAQKMEAQVDVLGALWL